MNAMANALNDPSKENAAKPLAMHHISVDCVVIGFDGEQLNVLLVKREVNRNGQIVHDMKLPGSLIYLDEDLDQAAKRVLCELTGLKDVNLAQFKAFGSKNRTSKQEDIAWLEHEMDAKVERIVTIAYLSLLKINRTVNNNLNENQACWVSIDKVNTLAFDHNQIISEALRFARQYVDTDPSLIFDLLPRKFTALQLRTIFGLLYGKHIDVRNFHKKMAMMEFVVPLDEKEVGVAHRAARFYRFDRKIYNRVRQ